MRARNDVSGRSSAQVICRCHLCRLIIASSEHINHLCPKENGASINYFFVSVLGAWSNGLGAMVAVRDLVQLEDHNRTRHNN